MPNPLYRLIWPPEPTATSTMLGTVLPAVQFRLEARGWGSPAGQTVKKLGAVVSVTVTLSITALTPLAGTPPCPRTWTLRLELAPVVSAGRRGSRILHGTTTWCVPPGAT